ncbi:chromosome partitioning protein ParB [Thioalkalivibrio versutus]|uniref:Probable chromosome-partitioning protein ParB n=1 Tax=Thioalkalivibrio versutus TaxID=106634 RepID=A0A0G3G9W4_9GAMM|nr:ParB/RepB/Spo0J family partition protein [Thioalkalivibrio versutus]AKJ96322.1 chromosome partitioning protein ParB [Thioalkalivibrio versutus]
MAKRGLGRGLDALLSGAQAGGDENDSLEQLPVEQIRRGKYQPRVHMAEAALAELADSIRAQGIVQPVVVRRLDDGYELIAGERRWRAAQIAGLETVPAVVRDIPDQAAAAMALIENIQREDLNPLEEAQAIRRLIGEFEMTHQAAADAVGRSRTAVTNLLRLLELHDTVKDHVNEGRLEMGHARCLLAVPLDDQPGVAATVVKRGLSVRATEQLVKKILAATPEPKKDAGPSPEVRQLETRLSDQLGAAVQVRYNRQGKGRLVIEYNSLDELDGILAHIQ